MNSSCTVIYDELCVGNGCVEPYFYLVLREHDLFIFFSIFIVSIFFF